MGKLVQKMLRELTDGTWVSVIYMEGTKEVCVEGEVTIDEPEMEVSGAVFRFEQVVSCRKISTGSTPAPELSTSNPAKPALVSTSTPTSTSSNDLLSRSPSAIRVALTPLEIQTMRRSEMPASDKKTPVGGHIDSYLNALQSHYLEGTVNAATRMARTMKEEYINGYCWSEATLRICGAMQWTAKQYSNDFFTDYGNRPMYPEASLYAWRNNENIRGAAFAALALLDSPPELEQDLVILLTQCSAKADDFSALPVLLDRFGPVKGEEMLRDCVDTLLRKKGQPTEGSFETKFKRLVDTTRSTRVKNLVEEKLDRTTTASAPIIPVVTRKIGYISSIRGIDQTGMICVNTPEYNDEERAYCFQKEEYSFEYNAITDGTLKAKLDNLGIGRLPDGEAWWVTFVPDGNRAKIIMPTDSPVETAAKAHSADAYSYLDNAVQAVYSPQMPDALVKIVKWAIQFAKIYDKDNKNRCLPLSDDVQWLLGETASLYEANSEKYPDRHDTMEALSDLYEWLGAYRRSFDFIERAYKNMVGARPLRQATYASKSAQRALAILDHDEADEGGYYSLENLCNLAIERATKWLDLYENEDEVKNGTQSMKIYPWVLEYRCLAHCRLGDLDEAEDDFKRVQKCATANFRTDNLEAEIAALRDASSTKAEVAPVDEEEIEDEAEESFVLSWAPAEETIPVNPSQEEDTPFLDEDELIYEDAGGWPALGLETKDVIDYAMSLSGETALPIALTYLRAAASLNSEIKPVYELLAAASNDPAYVADRSLGGMYTLIALAEQTSPELASGCLCASYLRTCFDIGEMPLYDIRSRLLPPGRDGIGGILSDLWTNMENFRNNNGVAVDIYAAYRDEIEEKVKSDLDDVVKAAQDLLDRPWGDKNPHINRLKELLFGNGSYLNAMLCAICDKDVTELQRLQADNAQFIERTLGDKWSESMNISTKVISNFITDAWTKMRKDYPTTSAAPDLKGRLRTNVQVRIENSLKIICRWYELDKQTSRRTDEGRRSFEVLRGGLVEGLIALSNACCEVIDGEKDNAAKMGLRVLMHTADELLGRLTGEWKMGGEKFMYVDFLRSAQVLLGENFIPDIHSTFCALPEMNILARIRKHAEGEWPTLKERLKQIFNEPGHEDYGTANRIIEYLQARDPEYVPVLPDDPGQYVKTSMDQAKLLLAQFEGYYSLADGRNAIRSSDTFCSTLKDTGRYWLNQAIRTENFSMLKPLLDAAKEKIHINAMAIGEELKSRLDEAKNNVSKEHPELPEDAKKAIQATLEQIEDQNFTVAENYINRIYAGDFEFRLEETAAKRYLDDFWKKYQDLWSSTNDTGYSLGELLDTPTSGKGQALVQAWEMEEGKERVENLLSCLGWLGIQVESESTALGFPVYQIRQSPTAVNMRSLFHPIAAFGSEIVDHGMQVICVTGGNYGAETFFNQVRQFDCTDGNKIIFLDCSFSAADRHALAKTFKAAENAIRNSYLVIDRVVLAYLAKYGFRGKSMTITKELLALCLPFSRCMPYVADSAHPLPPEIFIGRETQMQSIEDASGANLLYGGRQLGKTALLNRVRTNVNAEENRYAVYVDIYNKTCDDAASEIAFKLKESKLLDESQCAAVMNWEDLVDAIRSILNDEDLTYLLILIDEADGFIQDCGRSEIKYEPIRLLKELQMSSNRRFKFVLAGLHELARFNQTTLAGNSPVAHLDAIKITAFQPEEAEKLLTEPLSYLGLSFDSVATVTEVIASTNCFPGLIQLYAKKLLEALGAKDYAGYKENKTPSYDISKEHIQRVLADPDFCSQISQKLMMTLMLLEPDGQCYYEPIALLLALLFYHQENQENGGTDFTGYSAADIKRIASDWGTAPIIANMTDEKLDTLLSELVDLNVLIRHEGGYRFARRSFRHLLGTEEEIVDRLAQIS